MWGHGRGWLIRIAFTTSRGQNGLVPSLGQSWKTYEEVATFLHDKFAHEFGLKRVEPKQLVDGLRSGTKWEIDAKGIREGDSDFIIVELPSKTTSRQNQEKRERSKRFVPCFPH